MLANRCGTMVAEFIVLFLGLFAMAAIIDQSRCDLLNAVL